MTKSTAVIFILGFSLLFRLEKPVSIRISGYVKKSNNIKNVFLKLQNSFWYLLTLVFNANVKKKKYDVSRTMMLKSLTGKFLFQLEMHFSKHLLCSFKITSKYIFAD